jgi:hypothetical protein
LTSIPITAKIASLLAAPAEVILDAKIQVEIPLPSLNPVTPPAADALCGVTVMFRITFQADQETKKEMFQ